MSATTLTWAGPEEARQPAAVTAGTAATGVCFLLSFLQYCLRRADWVRLAPMAALFAGALLFLLLAAREQRRGVLRCLWRPGTLAGMALVTLPPLLASLYRSNWYPFEYGLLMVATLLAARVLLSGIGFTGLLKAFFYAMGLGMSVVAALTLPQLLASFGSQRYFPFFFEPNRIAFFAVTAIPAQLWFARRRRRNLYALGLSGLCALVAMAASSRGSTGALLIGAGATLALVMAGWPARARRGLSRRRVAAILLVLLAASGTAAARPAYLASAADYLWTKLDLGTRARGLDSGFTGRTNGWSTLLEMLPKTAWLTGNGYRSSDEDFDFSVDSGYLASAYELGLFATAVMLLQYAAVLGGLISVYLNRPTRAQGLLFAFFTLAVFFANGFVHRVLFGYGDPSSLFALFCFVSGRGDALAAAGS